MSLQWAAVMAATMLRSLDGRPRISTIPFGICYNNIDWAWLAPRRLAEAAFGVVKASCEWHRCVLNYTHTLHPSKTPADKLIKGAQGSPTARWSCGTVATYDAVLTEWWFSHGVPFDAMLTSSAQLNNYECAQSAQRLGLFTPENAPTFNRGQLCPRSKRHSDVGSGVEAELVIS